MKIPWDLSERQLLTVICCYICSFMVTFDIVMVSTNLGGIQDRFNVDYSYAMIFSQLLAISYVLFFMISIAVTDKFGKKRSLITGLVLLAISSLLCAFAWDMTSLMLFRLITGFGVSLIQTSCNSVITDTVDRKYLGEAMAGTYSCSSAGAILAPILGQAIVNAFGIGTLFLTVVPFSVILALVFRKIDNVMTRPELEINYTVHILYIASMFLLMCAAFGTTDMLRIAGAVLGAVLFVIMAYIHRRSDKKVIDTSIFRIHTFTFSILMSFMFLYVGCGIENSLSQFFQLADFNIDLFGILITSAAFAAFLTSFKPAIQALISPVIARYYRDRMTKNISLIGFILILISAVMCLGVFHMEHSMVCTVAILLIYVLHAFASSFFTPYNKKMMMISVPKENRNAASSVSSAVSTAASIVGVLTLVNLIDGTTTVESFIASADIMYVIVLAVAIFGTIMAVLRRNEKEM